MEFEMIDTKSSPTGYVVIEKINNVIFFGD